MLHHPSYLLIQCHSTLLFKVGGEKTFCACGSIQAVLVLFLLPFPDILL